VHLYFKRCSAYSTLIFDALPAKLSDSQFRVTFRAEHRWTCRIAFKRLPHETPLASVFLICRLLDWKKKASSRYCRTGFMLCFHFRMCDVKSTSRAMSSFVIIHFLSVKDRIIRIASVWFCFAPFLFRTGRIFLLPPSYEHRHSYIRIYIRHNL
jgi:hypothetical protein